MGNGPTSEFGMIESSAPWTKRAALILLFVLGLVFWIPPLLRATVGGGKAAASDEPVSIASEPSHSLPAEPRSLSEPTTIELSGSHGAVARSEAERFTLTGTILGRSRRAAILNGRLYREGDRIVSSGHSFRLLRVAEGRVELLRDPKSEGQIFPLVIRMARQNPVANSSSQDASHR